jgi:Uma2 family endonuclease
VVKSNINALLIRWLEPEHPGIVFAASPFQLDDYNVLIPDVGYCSEIPDPHDDTDLLDGAPEIAIEVISSKSAARLSRKISLYLSHGGKSVWTVFPDEQKVWIHTQGRAAQFERSETLEDPALPGFHPPVAALFKGL